MEKKSTTTSSERPVKKESAPQRGRKLSEYGRQLAEKQKVKEMYGVRERQFKRFYALATRGQEATGESLLTLLERRLDNVLFRMKMVTSRAQARQIIVHGHVLVNGSKVYSPSYLVSVADEVSFAPNVADKTGFLETVIDKKLQSASKAPDWVELDKKGRKGRILRLPVRSDIQTPIEEHLIVEGYSK